MSSSQASHYSAVISVTAWFIACLLGPVQPRAQPGTTPDIEHIVVGRCYDYTTLVNPSLRLDCEDIWRQFEESVVRQSSFNATLDYHQMFSAITQTWPRDMGLFWSKTRTLMHSYTAVERHFWTLEDTLVGYMFNGLVWCGQEDDSGFNFQSCPTWAEVKHHPVYSLWRQASQNFAEMAHGNITVLLNGSIANAFNMKSMFASVELDSLDPGRVDHVNIKLVTNLDGPFIESCDRGSVVDLIQILRSRGFARTTTSERLPSNRTPASRPTDVKADVVSVQTMCFPMSNADAVCPQDPDDPAVHQEPQTLLLPKHVQTASHSEGTSSCTESHE